MSAQHKDSTSQNAVGTSAHQDIDRWPVQGAGFNVRVTNALERAGIKTVGEVRQQEISHLLNLRSFGRRSLENVRWFFRCADQVARGEQFVRDFGELMASFLNPQERKVIEQRYGLTDPLFRPTMKQSTLDEIGSAMGGLTRERVRQVEFEALVALRSHLCRAAMMPLLNQWADRVGKQGGAIAAADLARWSDDPAFGRYQPCGVFLLLAELNDRIACRHGVYYSDAGPRQLDEIERSLLRVLEGASKPLPRGQILKLVGTAGSGSDRWNPNWIVALLQSHPEISGTRQDEFLLTRVGVPVMLAEILRTQSEPIHYEELTRLYNGLMEPASHQTARHILYVLGEMKSIRRLGNGEYKSK